MPPFAGWPLTTDKLRQALGDDVERVLRQHEKSGALHCKMEPQSRKVQDKGGTVRPSRCSC